MAALPPLSSSLFLLFCAAAFFFLSNFCTSAQPALTFTIVNNCPYTVWPAIQPNAGLEVLERGGFDLPTLAYRSFAAPNSQWSGRMWARTGCTDFNGRFSCITGDCGDKVECGGAGGRAPATLAQFSIHNGETDLSSYGVSVVDGFNTPMTVTPHEGKNLCPVVGCGANLLATCPLELQLHNPDQQGAIVACKSGCEVYQTDELCCRNYYASPQTCRPSIYSLFFKAACPSTLTYAFDTPSLMQQCSSPRELKIIFCP